MSDFATTDVPTEESDVDLDHEKRVPKRRISYSPPISTKHTKRPQSTVQQDTGVQTHLSLHNLPAVPAALLEGNAQQLYPSGGTTGETVVQMHEHQSRSDADNSQTQHHVTPVRPMLDDDHHHSSLASDSITFTTTQNVNAPRAHGGLVPVADLLSHDSDCACLVASATKEKIPHLGVIKSLIIFGRNVTDKESNPKLLYFPTSLN